MGHYQVRDLFLVPSLVSLLRLPLAALFVLASDEAGPACVVICVSGVTDIVDGAWARHFHQATPTGAVVDGVQKFSMQRMSILRKQ